MTRLKNGYGCHKNNIQIMDVDGHIVAKVGIGKNQTTTISLCDIGILLKHSFHAHSRKDGKFVAKSNKGTGPYLHRLIMLPDEEQEVDHVDGNPLNNTRGNLRRCTKRQNNLAKKRPLLKGYSGIHKTKWGWYKAFDSIGRKGGKFDTPLKAAILRDELMMDAYFHSESGEELHTFGFVSWNLPENNPHKAKLIESDDFLFDEIQEAQVQSYQLLEDHGWSCN
jgi:hypothetical protein